ncbi:MAG: O-antigen ligase family protein [Bacteroidota bacterium]
MRNFKIDTWALYLLSCFPLIGMKATVWAIGLFVLVALITGNYKSFLKNEKSIALLTSGLFFLILLRCLFPNQNPESLSYIEVSVSLLLIPMAFKLKSGAYNERETNFAGWLFISSTLIAFAYGMGYSLYQVSQMQIESQDLLSFHIRTFFENAVRYHPTYASVVLGAVMLKLLQKLLQRKNNPWLIGPLMIFTGIILALLASRTPIAATLACMVILVALQTKSVVKSGIMVAVIAASTVLFFQTVPSFSARFKEVSVENTKLPDKKSEDSFNLRTGIFHCGLGIIKEHWLWGVGPGQVKSLLNDCYNEIAPEVYKNKNFNTHNQFMDYWGGLGIWGPAMLILLFGFSVHTLWKRRDWTGVCILLLFLGAMQTENLLTRQNGIVAFCYLIALHIFVIGKSEVDPIKS